MSKQQPIAISIRSISGCYLSVENVLARKKTNSDSTGIGLSAIREKCKLLEREYIRIDENKNGYFAVNLPLINRAGVYPVRAFLL